MDSYRAVTMADAIRLCADDYYRNWRLSGYQMWDRICGAYERLFGEPLMPFADGGEEI